LLKCLVETKATTIQNRFRENLFFGEHIIDRKNIEKLISGKNFDLYDADSAAAQMIFFDKWVNGRLRGANIRIGPFYEQWDTLDGQYWVTWRLSGEAREKLQELVSS